MNLYLELEDYLAQWFINDQGGNNPVRLIRGSMEWGLLEQFLQTPPADYVPVVGARASCVSSFPTSAPRTRAAISTCRRKLPRR